MNKQRNLSENSEAEEDPFNFGRKKVETPVRDNNGSVKRPTFGDLKFFNFTPNGNMNKQELQLAPALLIKTPLLDIPKSETPKTPANKNGRRTPTLRKRKASEDAETPVKLAKVDTDNAFETPKTPASKSGRTTRASTAAASTTPVATPKARGKPGPKPKGTPKAAPPTKAASPIPETEEDESDSEASEDPSKFFDKSQFILTSANRESGSRPFTKKEVRKQIESRGGNVVETFESMNPDLTTYLIADTFYRTHKYLTALSLSVPTVSFKWINKCVEENKLVDYNDFMLDAGESETTGEVYKWKPLKGQILVGKKVAVYSKRGAPPTNNEIGFCQIWSPIVANLGAELIEGYPSEIAEAAEFFKNKHTTDYFIADDATPPELINAVTEGNGVPVSSEWIIQTIIAGVIASTSGNESYILQSKN